MSKFKKSHAALIFLTIISASAFAATKAQSETANDAISVTGNKITLSQAITAAETHVNGVAAKAEFENNGVYEIEVISKKDVYDVKVDAQSGAILSAASDKADHH